MWRFAAPAGIPFLIGIGVQLAGIESPWLGYAFMTIGLLWGIAYAVYYFFFRGEQAMAESGKGGDVHQNIGGDVVDSTIIGKQHVEFHGPQMGIRPETIFKKKKEADGRYHTRTALHIDANYAANGLVVMAQTNSTNGLDISPFPSKSGMSTVNDASPVLGNQPGHGGFRIGARLAPGYFFDVWTKEPEDVVVVAEFD